MLKNSLPEGHFNDIILLPGTVKNSGHGAESDVQLGPLHMYQDTHIFTYHGTGCFLIDPGLGTFVAHHKDVGRVVDVAVNGDEVFVLRTGQDRPIIRLAKVEDLTLGQFALFIGGL